jgi:hypothetical protein
LSTFFELVFGFSHPRDIMGAEQGAAEPDAAVRADHLRILGRERLEL